MFPIVTDPPKYEIDKGLFNSLFVIVQQLFIQKPYIVAECSSAARYAIKHKKVGTMEHYNVANPYFGVFVLFVLTFGAFYATTVIARLASRALAAKDTEKIKLSVYECGPEVTKQPNRISTQFYLFALLFLLFDVEIVFMFPWAIDFKLLGWFGFVEMMMFILLLAIGFVYAWKKGALEWHNIK
jgi:NADH-quinone oxidoreductase subunit A